MGGDKEGIVQANRFAHLTCLSAEIMTRYHWHIITQVTLFFRSEGDPWIYKSTLWYERSRDSLWGFERDT